MNIKRETESMVAYVNLLKQVNDIEFDEFTLNMIRSAFINGYRKGYNQRIEDCQDEIDNQSNIYAYEKQSK